MNALSDTPEPEGFRPFLVRREAPIGISPTREPGKGEVTLGLEPETEPQRACPSVRDLWLYSPALKVLSPLRCGRWDCPICGRVKKAAARELFTVGMERHSKGESRVRALTLTAPGKGGMTLVELAKGWNRFMTPYRRKRADGSRQVEAYAAVVEFQQRGEPHLHALLAGPEYLPLGELRRRAVGRKGSQGRFGPRVGIEEVESRESQSEYLSKFEALAVDLAGYLTKGRAEGFHREGRQRIRPVWASGDWYPGGLGAAEAVVKKRWAEEAGESERPEVSDWRLRRVDSLTGEVSDYGQLGESAAVYAFRRHLSQQPLASAA